MHVAYENCVLYGVSFFDQFLRPFIHFTVVNSFCNFSRFSQKMWEPYSGFYSDGWSPALKLKFERDYVVPPNHFHLGTIHWTLDVLCDQDMFTKAEELNVCFKSDLCLVHSRWGKNKFLVAYVKDGSQFSFLAGKLHK
jgi:hypothetical protein